MMQVDATQVARIVRWMNDTGNVPLSQEDLEIGELLGLIHLQRDSSDRTWVALRWPKFAPVRPWEGK